jgi:hypothetical protein
MGRNSFEQWLNKGIRKGWCTHMHCYPHDIPLTDNEEELMYTEEHFDPHFFIVRILEGEQ